MTGPADRRGPGMTPDAVDVRPPDVLTVGETLVAFQAEPGPMLTARALTKTIAGAETNVAIGLSRLGLRVAAVTRVGPDPFGAEVLRTLRAEAVDTRAVAVDAGRPTGLMVKERPTVDTANVWYYRAGSAAAALSPDDVDRALDTLGMPRHVHVTGITLALGDAPRAAVTHLLSRARAAGSSVSFDANHRKRLWDADAFLAACRPVAEQVDDLLCSDEEASLLTGRPEPVDALAELARWGPSRVVVRLGAEGALGRTADGPVLSVPAVAAGPVVDVVGAGDAYTTGYLAEILAGSGLSTALATGAWVAGQVVAAVGDWENLPHAAAWAARRSGRATVDR